MATRGVFQCQRLTLRYCEHGGSSRVVRDYLASGRLLEWATDRPTVEIKVKVANGKHPNLQAGYITTSVSNKSAMNGIQSKPVIHQVCLKSKGVVPTARPAAVNNNGDDEDDEHDAHWKNPIEAALNKLYNKSGRKMTKFTKPVYTDTPSIQGVWTPSLDLHLLPEEEKFNVKIINAAAAAATAATESSATA